MIALKIFFRIVMVIFAYTGMLENFDMADDYDPDEFGHAVHVVTGIMFGIVMFIFALGVENDPLALAFSYPFIFSFIVSCFFPGKRLQEIDEESDDDEEDE